MKLYEINIRSKDESYIRECVNKILRDLGLMAVFPWKEHPFYGSLSTRGGVELKESEGQYSLILYGFKKSEEAISIKTAITDTLKSGLEIKTVKLLKS